MKGVTQSKPSKASLVARGLAVKPVKGKRNVKTKKVPDAKPGYSLYSTDSEDQAPSVGRGLDRCAALLTNILVNDAKEPKKKKPIDNRLPVANKQRGKPVSTANSHRPVAAKTKAGTSLAKPIVIPTASQKDQGPSTLYNERLVASTPLLNSPEREKQKVLLEREKELTHQIHQLREHFELLQRQKSPEIQEQQKHMLQSSMLQELDDYQQNESVPSKDLGSTEYLPSTTREGRSPSNDTPSARRSLEYGIPTNAQSHRHGIGSEMEGEPEKQSILKRVTSSSDRNFDSASDEEQAFESTVGPPTNMSYRDNQIERPKKQVRVVSPEMSERYITNRSPSVNQEASEYISNHSRSSCSPVAADNEVRTIQYLTRELGELIGKSDDIEVNRLLMEIEQSCSLLPYMYTTSSSHDTQDLNVPRLRLENSQLRRNLSSAIEKNQHQELVMQRMESVQGGQASVSLELVACRSENASLQLQLNNERESKGKMLKEIGHLEKVVEDLREDKKKFIQILENKEQNHSKNRRSGQQEILRLSKEMRQIRAELEASKLSLEAARKENVIVNLSLKQKDTEIVRLGELTRGLQQSMRRVLGDIQEYRPNSAAHDVDLIDSQQLEFATDYARPIISTARSRGLEQTSEARDWVSNAAPVPTQEHRPPVLFTNSMDRKHSNNQREFEGRHIKSPLWSYEGHENRITNEPLSSEEPAFFSPKASLGPGAWAEGDFVYPSPEPNVKDADLSSLSSRDEEEFRRDLANLDADIARIQRSLRETATRH